MGEIRLNRLYLCVHVCVCKREREGERERSCMGERKGRRKVCRVWEGDKKGPSVSIFVYINASWKERERKVCVLTSSRERKSHVRQGCQGPLRMRDIAVRVCARLAYLFLSLQTINSPLFFAHSQPFISSLLFYFILFNLFLFLCFKHPGCFQGFWQILTSCQYLSFLSWNEDFPPHFTFEKKNMPRGCTLLGKKKPKKQPNKPNDNNNNSYPLFRKMDQGVGGKSIFLNRCFDFKAQKCLGRPPVSVPYFLNTTNK